MLSGNEMWNPQTWKAPDYEFRMYGDDKAQTWAVVDEIDYLYLLHWRWYPHRSSTGRRKFYMARKAHVTLQPGASRTKRKTPTIFMHHVIMQRAGIKRPSLFHVADHEDGDGFNCRRKNLSWLTTAENNANGSKHAVYDPNWFLELLHPGPCPLSI